MSYTWGPVSHYLMRLTRNGKEWSWRCSCREAEGTVKDRAAAHTAFAEHLRDTKTKDGK